MMCSNPRFEEKLPKDFEFEFIYKESQRYSRVTKSEIDNSAIKELESLLAPSISKQDFDDLQKKLSNQLKRVADLEKENADLKDTIEANTKDLQTLLDKQTKALMTLQRPFETDISTFKDQCERVITQKREEIETIKARNRCKKCPLCLEGFEGDLKGSEQVINSLRKAVNSKEEKLLSQEETIKGLANTVLSISQNAFKLQTEIVATTDKNMAKEKDLFKVKHRELRQEMAKTDQLKQDLKDAQRREAQRQMDLKKMKNDFQQIQLSEAHARADLKAYRKKYEGMDRIIEDAKNGEKQRDLLQKKLKQYQEKLDEAKDLESALKQIKQKREQYKS